MSTPTRAVLFNGDLLGIILEHTPRVDVTNIRLCNRAMSIAASPYLFRTLLVSSRKRHLRRMKFVAGHALFSRGVRKIVWEATAYGKKSHHHTPSSYLNLVRRLVFPSPPVPPEEEIESARRRKKLVGWRLNELTLDEGQLWGGDAQRRWRMH